LDPKSPWSAERIRDDYLGKSQRRDPAVMRDSDSDFQELADEAFADPLKKRKQPVGLKASLKESIGLRSKPSKRG
jgi:hypothetical protein